MKNNKHPFEWDKKVKLIQLANISVDKDSRATFVQYVVDNMKDFDDQAWDMFYTAIALIPDEIKENIDSHRLIFENSKDLTGDSMRTCIRMARYEQIVTQTK